MAVSSRIEESRRHLDSKLCRIWEQQRALCEGVGADGGKEDGRDFGVHHGSSRCQIIRGAASRRGNNQSIPLQNHQPTNLDDIISNSNTGTFEKSSLSNNITAAAFRSVDHAVN